MAPTIEESNPDLIEAEADDLESKALALRAKAKRIRAAKADGSLDEVLDDAGVRRVFGVPIRSCTDAKRRGEPIEILYVGRSPRIRRSDGEAHMRWRSSKVTKPKTPPAANDTADAQYEALVSGRRSA